MPTLEELRKQRQQRAREIPTDVPGVEPPKAPSTAPMPDEQPSAELNWQAPERKLDAPEWEAARKNPALLGAIKRYAKNVEDADFSSDDQAFDWFVGDRRWKDSNTISTLKELNFVKGTFGAKYASEEDLKDLSVIRDEWDKLPGGFTRIGRGIKDLNASEVVGGAGAILENVAKGTVDPSILIGGLFGKGAGALVTRGGSAATKAGVKRALQTGTAISADAGIAAGSNAAYQEVNVEAGLQDEISGWEMIVSGGLGGALSAPGAISTFKPKGLEKVDPLKAAEQAIRTDADRREKGLGSLFGDKGPNQTPDGRKLSTEDVSLMQDNTLTFENFSKEFSKATGVSRKGTGLMGSKVVEADETFYDPLLDTMHVKAGSKLSKEDVAVLEPLASPITDAKWKKEKLSVTIEDGSKVEVEAGTVAKSLTARLKQADELMMCLTK
jgi:hypothetical protein